LFFQKWCLFSLFEIQKVRIILFHYKNALEDDNIIEDVVEINEDEDDILDNEIKVANEIDLSVIMEIIEISENNIIEIY